MYGATKSVISYFTRGLVKEAENTPVRVGILSPGIVVTDLLTAGDIEGSRRSLNAVADRIEAVAPFLVARIRKNDRHDARINWLSTRKLAWRLARLPYNTRDPFAEKTKELGGGRA